MSDVVSCNSRDADHRAKRLVTLLGLSHTDASDLSLAGRLKMISRLRAARLAEVKRGLTKSWLYDVNRHLTICAALRVEYEALADSLDAVDAVIWRRTPRRDRAETERLL